MKGWLELCLAAVLLVSTAAAEADEQKSLQAMIDQQSAIRNDLKDASGLTARQKRLITQAQNEFFKIVEGKTEIAALSIEEKVRVRNALETVNAQIQGTRLATESQDVCWREAKTGSNVKVTRCATHAEQDEAREGARAWMAKPKICVPPGCGT